MSGTDWSNPLQGNTGTPPEGVPRHVQELRIEMDALLRRHGVSGGLAALAGSSGGRSGFSDMAVDHMVRTEDHQRLNAATRAAMRSAALHSWSHSSVSEQTRGNFIAFIMKGCLPAVGNGWVLPYSSWAEATEAFMDLYRNEAKWNEWVSDVS